MSFNELLSPYEKFPFLQVGYIGIKHICSCFLENNCLAVSIKLLVSSLICLVLEVKELQLDYYHVATQGDPKILLGVYPSPLECEPEHLDEEY